MYTNFYLGLNKRAAVSLTQINSGLDTAANIKRYGDLIEGGIGFYQGVLRNPYKRALGYGISTGALKGYLFSHLLAHALGSDSGGAPALLSTGLGALGGAVRSTGGYFFGRGARSLEEALKKMITSK